MFRYILVMFVTLTPLAGSEWFFNWLNELGVINVPSWLRVLFAALMLGLYFEYAALPVMRLMKERRRNSKRRRGK